MDNIQVQIRMALHSLYVRCQKEGVKPASYIRERIDEDVNPVETVRWLISHGPESYGLDRLYLKGKLRLSTEWLVLTDERFRSLFPKDGSDFKTSWRNIEQYDPRLLQEVVHS